jgi:predicted ATP-dependent serine protease
MEKKEEEADVQVDIRAEKLKALQAAMTKIEKDCGKGAVMKMGDEQVSDVEVISTGSIGLNAALGVGGYPRGRIIEIYGPESSGKTTLAIHAMAEAQKAGGIAAFIDAEHAFDRFYAEKLGVDVNNLYIAQPDNGEQALEIADQLIRSSAVDIVVVDNLATAACQIVGRAWRFRIHEPLVAELPDQLGVLLPERLAAARVPLSDGQGDDPGVELHAALVALVDGKAEHVVAR